MKKLRGAKQHYRKIAKYMERFKEHFVELEDTTSWFDMLHEHLDGYGFSSRVRYRRKHIMCYIQLLRQLKEIDITTSKPFQTFIFVDPFDSTDDAAFLHTPNPNGDNYPFNNSDIEWIDNVPKLLDRLVNLDEFEIGQIKQDGGKTSYFIRMIGLGDSLR